MISELFHLPDNKDRFFDKNIEFYVDFLKSIDAGLDDYMANNQVLCYKYSCEDVKYFLKNYINNINKDIKLTISVDILTEEDTFSCSEFVVDSYMESDIFKQAGNLEVALDEGYNAYHVKLVENATSVEAELIYTFKKDSFLKDINDIITDNIPKIVIDNSKFNFN